MGGEVEWVWGCVGVGEGVVGLPVGAPEGRGGLRGAGGLGSIEDIGHISRYIEAVLRYVTIG